MTAEIACGLSAAGAWIGQIKSKEPTEQKYVILKRKKYIM
jgi:hypothetical protein